MLLVNKGTKGYYHDEETNEIYQDNIGLDFKLNGYLSCQKPEISRTLCSEDAKPLKLNFQPWGDIEPFIDIDTDIYYDDFRNEAPRLDYQIWSQDKPTHIENDIIDEFKYSSTSSSSPDHYTNLDFQNAWDHLDRDNCLSRISSLSELSGTLESNSKNSFDSVVSAIEMYLNENFDNVPSTDSLVVTHKSKQIIPKKHFKNNLKTASKGLYNISSVASKLPSTSIIPRFKDSSNIAESLIDTFRDTVDHKKKYSCNHCDESITSLKGLILHYEEHNLFRHLKYRCVVNECPFKIIGFNKKILLRKHLIIEHFNGKDPSNNIKNKQEHELVKQLLFICPKCDKLFSRRDTSQRHEKTVHKPKVKRKR